jgi:hypothetical protein
MYLNASEKTRELGDYARQERDIRLVEFVGYPVQQDCMKTRVAKKNLKDALGRRVFAKYGTDLFPDCPKHNLPGLTPAVI